MNSCSISFRAVTIVVVGLMGMLMEDNACAQISRPNPAAANRPVPRLADGRPDFTGFFNRYREDNLTRLEDGTAFYNYGGANEPQLAAKRQRPNQPPYKPEYMEKVTAIANQMYGGNTAIDPQMDCKPLGVPRAGLSEMEIVHTSSIMAILYEESPGPVFRLIYLDGRKHPENLDTSYFGHSIGHWEGDTLVVDTVGLNDETWLGGSQSGDQKYTSIHSDKLHVIERWTRTGNMVFVQATVEDPVMFTRPWVLEPARGMLAPDDDYIQPQMCVSFSKNHLIKPSEKDPDLVCGWCNPEKVYGLESDKITNQDYAKPRP